MSLSRFSSTRANLTGKVVVGMNTPGPDEMTIQELEGKRQIKWDDATNEEYLNRVKDKAMKAAKEIKILAELETEALRATARHDGYEEGLAQAQEELDQHVQALTAQTEDMLAKIGAFGSAIYENRRQDILSLIRLAVEKTLKVELAEQRRASLEALMQEALERIESQRQIDIRCHPADVEGLESFLASIKERNPALKYWSVKGDSSIESGGMLVEATSGKVDNTIETRWKGVEPIFEQLATQLTASDEGER